MFNEIVRLFSRKPLKESLCICDYHNLCLHSLGQFILSFYILGFILDRVYNLSFCMCDNFNDMDTNLF